MEINLEALQNARVPVRQVSSDTIRRRLESAGWLESVAGASDFAKAVKAIVAMYASGRGILVTGEPGCGKTHLLHAMQKIMGCDSTNWFYCKERGDLDILRGGDSYPLDESVFLDDIGSEEPLREYGNRIDVVGDFIQKYHYRGKGRFMASTNLDSDELDARYNGRVFDRLVEMCVIFKLEGQSKRKAIVI